MKPAPRLLIAVALWALSAISLLFFSGSIASLLWWAAGAILAAFALLDLLHGWRRPAPSAERIVPNALSVQQPHAIKVRIPSAELPARATLADHHPGDDPLTGLPCLLTRAENELTEFTYHYRPSRRGPVAFGDLEFWFPSQLGFWSLRKTCPAHCIVPVYPDFSRISQTQLDANHSFLLTGSRLKPRRGEGMEFHQLRELSLIHI